MYGDISKYEPFFGSWHITKELGQGASGKLYQIEKTDSLGNKYHSALKVISIPSGGDSEIKSILSSGVSEEELENYYQGVLTNSSSLLSILSKLKGNNNIVSYLNHEIVRNNDTFGWIVLIQMEQLTPLIEYSLKHELSEDQVIKMGMDICKGLSLCSKHNIIHRDIKPENIFVSDNGDFKIGDFGIARVTEQAQTSLSRKGTYTYMSPEMFKGDNYNENVDIYSLGLVMYKYLNNGRDPFMPEYPKQIVHEDNETSFAKRMSGYAIPQPMHGSQRLKEIILNACAYNPKDRYATADEMLCNLEKLIKKV